MNWLQLVTSHYGALGERLNPVFGGELMYIFRLEKEQCVYHHASVSIKSEDTNTRPRLIRFSQGLMADFHDNFAVEIAESAQQLREAYRLRYQTYCVERGFEASITGLEIDEFDCRARHVVLRHRRSGEAAGTVRLVRPDPQAPLDSLPMQRLCEAEHLRSLPVLSTAEISRFAVPKRSRNMAQASSALMRLGLMRGLLKMSREMALTHWCAVMERSLLRLLQSTAMHFHPVGPVVEHHGIRQPSYANIESVLARIHREQAAIWDYVTEFGKLALA